MNKPGTIARCSIFVFFLSAFIWLAACERPLSGSERAVVLALSEPVVANLFDGLSAADYQVFSRDFDSDMHERVPATDFPAWKQDLDLKFGDYLARQVDQVTQADEFYVVVYQAQFEKDSPVQVTVAFHRSGTIAFLSLETENSS